MASCPGECLTETQAVHKEKCGPYYLVEVEEEAVHLELLVRASGKMRCECVSFANKELRDRMIAYLEEQLTDLNVLF